jgi:uncharacterized protein YecT (DUF1311 family)
MIEAAVLAILAAASGVVAPTCDGRTTAEVNACMDQRLDHSEARLRRYRQAAVDRVTKESGREVRLGLEKSEMAFEAYRDAECRAVAAFWNGTISGTMEFDCRIRLTDARTHALWQNWLRYPDSTPPILPEPPQVRCDRLKCHEQ